MTWGGRVRPQGRRQDYGIRDCSHVPQMRIFLSDSGTSEEGNFLPIKTIIPGTLKIVTINLKGISAEHGGRDIKKPNLKVSMVVTAKFLRKLCCQRSRGWACRRVRLATTATLLTALHAPAGPQRLRDQQRTPADRARGHGRQWTRMSFQRGLPGLPDRVTKELTPLLGRGSSEGSINQ